MPTDLRLLELRTRQVGSVAPELPLLVNDGGHWQEYRGVADQPHPPQWFAGESAADELALRRFVAVGGAWIFAKDDQGFHLDPLCAWMVGLADGRTSLDAFLALIHEGDSEPFRRQLAHLIDRSFDILQVDLRVRWQNGWRWIRMQGRRWDDNRIAGSMLDANELHLGREVGTPGFYSHLFHRHRSFTAIFGLDGKLVEISDNCTEIMGYTREEFLGVDGFQFIHPDDRGIPAEAFGRLMQGEVEVGPLEFRQRHFSGKWQWVEAYGRRAEDPRWGSVVIAHHWMIDDRKKLAEELAFQRDHLEHLVQERTAGLQRANELLTLRESQLVRGATLRALGSLVAGVVHEISVPLAAAELGLHLGQKHSTDAETRSALAKAQTALRHAQTVVDNLRNTIRERPTATFTTEDIGTVMATAYGLVEHRCHLAKASLTWDLHSPILVFIPTGRMVQAFVNLLLNACQALGPDGGDIRIGAHEAAGRWVITIRDNGAGMPEAVRQRLGEPFFTTRSDHGGLGLGVAVTLGIIQECGGTLDYQSELGKGTTALVSLPAATER